MIQIDQTIFDVGKGNCFAACIASILEIPINDVIHFPNGDCSNWREIINDWLKEKDMFFIDLILPGDMRDEQIKYWGYHIIMGDSPRCGDIRHAVVGYKGEIIFDPHPSRSGLLGTNFTYGLLVRKSYNIYSPLSSLI